jgi:hypothetical protein
VLGLSDHWVLQSVRGKRVQGVTECWVCGFVLSTDLLVGFSRRGFVMVMFDVERWVMCEFGFPGRGGFVERWAFLGGVFCGLESDGPFVGLMHWW